MVHWGMIVSVGLCCLLIMIKKSEACAPTFSEEDETCLVGTTPFGSFSPAPGSTVEEGDTVTLTCNPFTRLDGTVVTATCSSAGVLSPTSSCLPCPDTTWVYDSTTNRCFKAFAGVDVPGVCTKDVPCANVAASLGTPVTLAYTFNFQALIDAGRIALDTGVGIGIYLVGIGDPVANELYQFDDGTPVPLASIMPFFTPLNPSDNAANTQQYIAVRTLNGGFGFDDYACFLPGFRPGSICQIQL
uniref:Sushi domain-containing protein n=1 Tax=Plectus sambesii TaxID=2011161 RepID=A0A914VG20_9BILA